MSEKEEFSKLTSIKGCPICDRKLDRGYVIPPRGIRWDTKKHKFSYLPLEEIVFSPILTLQNVPASRCKQCEIVVFDCEKSRAEIPVRPETPKSFLRKCVRCGKEIPIAELQCQYCGSKQN